MGCCGNKRAAASAAARGQGGSGSLSRAAPTAMTAGRPADVVVRYIGGGPVRVRGTASGRVYHSSPAAPLLQIDGRDAAALVRTGLFQP